MRHLNMTSLGLLALTFAAGLSIASPAAAMTQLDWSNEVLFRWDAGELVRTYSLEADNVDLTISISASSPNPGMGQGSFASWDGLSASPPGACVSVVSPNKDGAPAPSLYRTDRFGTGLDLGVVFDPAANSDQAVLINLKFTELHSGATGRAKAVATFKFEISDIDWSHGGNDCFQLAIQGWRRDQVVITANHGATSVPVSAFTLSPKVGSPTFAIGPPNTATAIGNATSGAESNADDNGTLIVSFGATFVTEVQISYNEAGFSNSGVIPNNNPGYRGIGILGGNTTLPVELMEFTIE